MAYCPKQAESFTRKESATAIAQPPTKPMDSIWRPFLLLSY